ncbi:hypothetical protein F0562_002312 [Nyssa sinensis]|uniref:Myb-like domain-containing protein n=1 Tax=Nyssa sinensis TaxID=561372 RepID=A0A5J5C5N8_9ASTE|nr:hypothetical protein F0562_002312 [Nyssa sinensis]
MKRETENLLNRWPAPFSPPPLPPPEDPDQNPDHQDPPSPSPTPSNPSSPKPLQSIFPPQKTQPLPWSHQETINLIQAYQEKWYSLKKGQLKASQWEEVAITVAARCGYDEPSKTATQCRHKIEKLRKRYRTEKQRPYPNAWQYFDLMDRMERGPLPISARPMAMIQYQNSNSSDDEEDDDANYNDDSKKNKSKSINHIVRGHMNTNKPSMDRKLGSGSDKISRVLQNPMSRKRKEYLDSDEEEEEDEDEEVEVEVEEGGGGRDVVADLAAEIRAFAERFVKMENKKMEMMRETERCRMDMENKRMEMILQSQRKIVDTIVTFYCKHRRTKQLAQPNDSILWKKSCPTCAAGELLFVKM